MLLLSQKEAGPHGPPHLGVVVCRPVLVGQSRREDRSSRAVTRRGLVVILPPGDTRWSLCPDGGQILCSGLSLSCVSGVKGKVLLPEEEGESKGRGRGE